MPTSQWGQLGMQVAGNTANTAMGMLAQRVGANYDRKQQLKTQKALMDMQMPYNLAMMKSQKDMDYDMWLKTGIVGQGEQLDIAGMNKALLYGGGGGGGQTVGGSSGGMSAPNAGVIPTGMGMEGINMADIQLKASQARLNNTQADKLSGVDTKNTEADTGQKLANTGNTEADTKLKQIEERILKIDEWIKDKSKESAAEQIAWTSQKTMNEMNNLWREGLLLAAQYDDKVEMLKLQLVGKSLENALTRAATKNVQADTKNKGTQNTLLNTQIKTEIAERLQSWKKLELEDRRIEIDKYLKDKGLDQEARRDELRAIEGILDFGTKNKKPHDSVENDESYTEYGDESKTEYRKKRRTYN